MSPVIVNYGSSPVKLVNNNEWYLDSIDLV